MLYRVFIVDDNPSVRTEIRAQLEASGFAICGEAFDGLNAVEQASQLRPDLIILDLSIHSALIRSEVSLPEGITEVVDKREDLLHRVLRLLPKSDAALGGTAL
jgi:DNA-binding NarL/FixJ family response regulator